MATLDDRCESSGATLENPSTTDVAESSRLDAGMDGRASSANARAASGPPKSTTQQPRLPSAALRGAFHARWIDPRPRAEMDPRGTLYPDRWFTIETIWNSIFIVELVWNMYGCFYLTQWEGNFFSSG